MQLDTVVEVTLAVLILVVAVERALLAREAWRRLHPPRGKPRVGFDRKPD